MTFNFHPSCRDPQVFLNTQEVRQLFDNGIWSIDNMTDEEVSESIIDDLLGVTMWEKQTGQKLHFDFAELVKFLPRDDQHARVRRLLEQDEVKRFICMGQFSGNLRIRNDEETLKTAMDYAGVYYGDDVDMPEDVLVTDPDVMDEAIAKYGLGLEGMAAAMSMELIAMQMNYPAMKPVLH